jgi:hypothetical protein
MDEEEMSRRARARFSRARRGSRGQQDFADREKEDVSDYETRRSRDGDYDALPAPIATLRKFWYLVLLLAVFLPPDIWPLIGVLGAVMYIFYRGWRKWVDVVVG